MMNNYELVEGSQSQYSRQDYMFGRVYWSREDAQHKRFTLVMEFSKIENRRFEGTITPISNGSLKAPIIDKDSRYLQEVLK